VTFWISLLTRSLPCQWIIDVRSVRTIENTLETSSIIQITLASRVPESPETCIAWSFYPQPFRFYHLNGILSKYSVSLTLRIYANVLWKKRKCYRNRKRKRKILRFSSYWKTATTSRHISRLFGIHRVHKVDCAQPCSFCIMPGRDKHPGRWLFRSCHGCLSYSLYILIYSPQLNMDGKIVRI